MAKNKTYLLALPLALVLYGAPALAQELYYGDDAGSDQAPEEYYLEGIGYGTEASGAEDTSYTGLYSPSSDDAVYGGSSPDYSMSGSDEPAGPSYDQPIILGSEAYALPSNPTANPGSADAADFFSMSGVALVEAIGEGSDRVVITRDGEGKFQVLKAGETKTGAFKIVEIGSEQARVEPTTGGAAKVVPILHRSAPVDTFLAALARLQNLRLVVSKTLSKEVAFDPEMLKGEDGFSTHFASLGVYAKRFDDVLVVRETPFLDGAKAYSPEGDLPEGESLELGYLRGTGDEVLQMISDANPEGVTGGPDVTPSTVTMLMGSTPAAEALHYLNMAWGTSYRFPAPKKTEAQASAPAPSAKVDALYAEAVALAKKGDLKGAGKRLLWICKNGSKDAKHFIALGKIYWKLGRTEHALRAWKASLKVDPANATAQRILAKAEAKLAG